MLKIKIKDFLLKIKNFLRVLIKIILTRQKKLKNNFISNNIKKTKNFNDNKNNNLIKNNKCIKK